MIVLDSISREYENGRVVAVDKISLEIGSGETVALRGPSGAGKSTLLNLIGGIDRPSSGQIVVNAIDLAEHARLHRFRAGCIGFVFQFHHLLPQLTALENIEIPLIGGGLSRSDRRRRARQLLEATGIGDLGGQFPGRLSGGERQRVAVARALANQPPVVLADEPTGSLDAESGKQIIDLLIDYGKRNSATLIVATHNETVADRMGRKLFMEFGKIVRDSAN